MPRDGLETERHEVAGDRVEQALEDRVVDPLFEPEVVVEQLAIVAQPGKREAAALGHDHIHWDGWPHATISKAHQVTRRAARPRQTGDGVART